MKSQRNSPKCYKDPANSLQTERKQNKSGGNLLNSMEITYSRFTHPKQSPENQDQLLSKGKERCCECSKWEKWSKKAEVSFLKIEQDLIQKEQTFQTLIEKLKIQNKYQADLILHQEQEIKKLHLIFVNAFEKIKEKNYSNLFPNASELQKIYHTHIINESTPFAHRPENHLKAQNFQNSTKVVKIKKQKNAPKQGQNCEDQIKENDEENTSNLFECENISPQLQNFRKKLSKSYLSPEQKKIQFARAAYRRKQSENYLNGQILPQTPFNVFRKSRTNQTLTDCSYFQGQDGIKMEKGRNTKKANISSEEGKVQCPENFDTRMKQDILSKLLFENQNLKSYNKVLLEKLSNSKARKY